MFEIMYFIFVFNLGGYFNLFRQDGECYGSGFQVGRGVNFLLGCLVFFLIYFNFSLLMIYKIYVKIDIFWIKVFNFCFQEFRYYIMLVNIKSKIKENI